jgi:hypothetical protein
MWPLEKTFPRNLGQGAEFPGSTKGGNSGLGAEILAPRKFQNGIFGQKFRPFPEGRTTARVKGLSEKSRVPEILEFLAPGNSA